MTERTNLDVIDADAHVIETEHTWDYLEASNGSSGRAYSHRPTNRVANTG
jgi:hypothetical protein